MDMYNWKSYGQAYSQLNTGLRTEMQSVLGPTTMYNNISKKEESFYDNDPTSDSDDSYISIDQDTLPPPLPPPLRIHSSSELPFSSHTLQERKKFLKNVPPVPPKPNRQTMTYDSLSLKNNAVDINQTAETNDSSSVYEEIPDCRMEPTLSKIISPPPPPRINKSLPSPCHYESSLHCIAPNEEYIPTSDEMSLGEFVSKYQNDFPVRIRVSRGFYGTTDQWSISEGEYFNIHFLKKTKVISALDGCFGCYNIPINSSATFGFLYMENDDINEGIKGYNFPTAGDILEASNPPQIVKVQLNYGKSTEQSIRVGDLLIIQGNKGRLRKTLKCLNVKTREKKLLQSNCKGSFTTCPKDTQLFLPEIIEHFKLPTNFVMYINTDSIVNSEEMSFSHRVQLSHCSIETSLIATQLDRRINDGGTPSIIEIPMDLDIGVELVIPRDDEAAQLYEETGKLYETLDIATIQTIPSNVGSLQRDPTTAEALVACHKKNKNVGIEIQQPPRYFKGKVANTSIFKVPNESICPSYVKQNSTCGSTSATILSLSKSPSNVIYKKMENLKSTMEEHSNELKKINHQVSQLNRTQKSILSMYSKLEEELRSLSLQITHNHSVSTSLPPVSAVNLKKSKSDASMHKKNLELLSQNEVMKILKNVGLQHYQPLFRSRNITGKQLSTMTEGDLKHMGVAVEHLGNIMNVIEGVLTPQDVLDSINV